MAQLTGLGYDWRRTPLVQTDAVLSTTRLARLVLNSVICDGLTVFDDLSFRGAKRRGIWAGRSSHPQIPTFGRNDISHLHLDAVLESIMLDDFFLI